MHCLCVGMPGGHRERAGGGHLVPTMGTPGQTRSHGKAASWTQQHCRGLWFKYPPKAGGTSLCPEQSLDRRARENPVLWSSVQKGTQSKGNRPGAKGRGHQESEVTAVQEESGSRSLYSREPSPSSQALAARRGAGPIFSIQITKPKVTTLRSASLCPQHPGMGCDLVQGGPF